MISTCFVFELFLSGSLSKTLAAMSTSRTSEDKFFANVIKPYLAEVKAHPKVLQLKEGVLQIQDLQGPKKDGDMKARLEEVEQEVFKCKEMVLRGVDANYRIISELIAEHEKETKGLQEKVLLCKETASLQAQIYVISNQNCEYAARFKRISDAVSFRILEAESSFVDAWEATFMEV